MEKENLFNPVEFGGRVRYLRNSMNLSLNQLSRSIGVTKGFLGLVERGERGLSLEYLCRLADALQVSTDELLISSTNDDHDKISPLQGKAYVLLQSLNNTEAQLIIDIMESIKRLEEGAVS